MQCYVQTHVGKKNSIDWKNVSFVFNNKNKEDLHMVEFARIKAA